MHIDLPLSGLVVAVGPHLPAQPVTITLDQHAIPGVLLNRERHLDAVQGGIAALAIDPQLQLVGGAIRLIGRSEERRVGKEWSGRWGLSDWRAASVDA